MSSTTPPPRDAGGSTPAGPGPAVGAEDRFEGRSGPPLVLASLSPEAYAEVKVKDGIALSRQAAPGFDVDAVKTEMVVAAPLAAVLGALARPEIGADWMSGVKKVELVSRASPGEFRYHVRNASPSMFVSDRDVVVDATVELALGGRRATIVGRAVKDAPADRGAVRMERFESRARLEALGADRTRVVQEVVFDPGGSVPASLVNLAATGVPMENARGLRDLVEGPRGAELAAAARGDFAGLAAR